MPIHNSCRKGVTRNAGFLHGCLNVSYRSWDKSKTHVYVEITHFQTWCIIRTGKALNMWPHAFHAPMMHLIARCVIQVWVLFILLQEADLDNDLNESHWWSHYVKYWYYVPHSWNSTMLFVIIVIINNSFLIHNKYIELWSWIWEYILSGIQLTNCCYHFCFLQRWNDERLSWNNEDYPNVWIIILDSDVIWIPDIVTINRCETLSYPVEWEKMS